MATCGRGSRGASLELSFVEGIVKQIAANEKIFRENFGNLQGIETLGDSGGNVWR